MINENHKNKFNNFSLAMDRLTEVVLESKKAPSNTFVQDSLIQRFEFTFELSWKTMQEYLSYSGKSVALPRDIITTSNGVGLISNGEKWLAAMLDRNKTSHIYDQEIANQVCHKIQETYYDLLVEFQKKITELYDQK